ncbi:MAG: alpha-2-macroglobulin family protein, partial [Pseudomonadota bacterium]
KSVAGSSNVEYVGVDRLVGLKSTKWVFEKDKPATIDTLVVDDKGIPAAGLNIVADIEHQEVVTAKVKGAGNAYLSDTTVTWNKVDNCKLISTDKPVPCTFTPKSSGSYRLTASIKDTKGRHHQTQIGLWATGEDYVQWSDQSEQYTLPLIPEKKEWNVGDTARYLVKNPYPGAKALVSVERYGILDSFVTTLEGSTPIISIPVKPDYVPGFYVSVSVVSPRVAGEIPKDGQIDMGKPAFRMGYVAVPVKDPYKDIIVKVTPENKIYRPRDMINVQLTATPKHNDDKKEPMELAVAVLDESVFDLIAAGRAAFDPYQGFYNLDSLDLENYSLLSALIGRQKFEKKGANVGGDGGTDLGVRDIFKFVSYWNPSVKLNSKGQATINFPATDNLTGWRILAMAVTPTDKMGLGEGSFKVNRPTELRPTMPNQVHEGDRFVASFSVMNRTDKERTLDVNIEASGDVLGHKTVLKTEKVTLGSYKRTIVSVPLDVALLPIERDKPEGSIHFKASAADSLDSDATVHDVPVFKARALEVGANYASTTADKATESIVIPKDIFTDIGDISVVFAPSVIGNLEGAFRYMRDYAYPCWEQQMTRAVMAAHYINLKSWVSDKFQWTDAAKVTQETLDGASAFQAPNGGMTYFVATDEHADPYLSAYTAIAFGWMIKSGYHVPEDVSDKLDAYLLNFLKQDAAPDFYQKGMSSTVRAVALAALAQSNKVTKDDVLRYRSAVPEMSLFGKAQFMDAAVSLNMPDIAKEIANKIFATGNETGGKFMFQETYDDGYARILATPLRDNCQILTSFSHFAALPEGKALMGDKPFKLVRMITESRGNRDHWENTQENMFCMNALTDYARAYEQEKPKMQITAKLDATKIGEVTFADYKDPPQTVIQNLVEGDAGKSTTLNIEKVGTGRLYYSTRLRYAPKITPENVNSGFDIHREYSVRNKGAWAILKEPVALHRGDVVRVDLFVSLPAARNFVVVNDPLPGGLETVN